MRLAIISDVHANFEALKALTDILASADVVVCLGDLVGYYCQVNEVLDAVRDLNAICVLGNHDSFLLHGCPPELPPAVRFGIAHADRVITADHRRWLASLPLMWGGVLGERSLLAVHGSPWRPLTDYLYADSPLIERLEAFAGYDVIAFGQTHRALLYSDQRPLRVNPGSVGQSRDVVAEAHALIVDTETLILDPVRRPFDANMVMDLALSFGAEAWIRKHLT